MGREQTKQTLKLQLLAFVLALALVWYSLNPAPRAITRRKRDNELPDEKKRNLEPQRVPAILPIAFKLRGGAAKPLPSPNEDEFDWPEFIDG